MSTADVPGAQRHAYWREIFCEPGRSMAMDGQPDAFHGVLTRLVAGELTLMSVKSSPLVTRCRPWEVDDHEYFSLHLVHSGLCQLRHAGQEVVAQTGDMIIVDARRSYELAFAKPVDGLVLSLPRAQFQSHAATLESLAGRPIGINRGPAAVLSGFIRSAWDQLVEGDGEEWPDSATGVIWDLMASVLRNDRVDQSDASRPEALRRRALALIDHQLSDPDFRSSAIPGELGVSARYLQCVLAETGTTPSRLLLARRLDAAAARLRSGDASCRITDVALECGFNDLSYFSRTFRRRFGVSARRYRLHRGVRGMDLL